jgi:hypothetical protein
METSVAEGTTRIEEVRLRYMEARRVEHTLEGIRLARIVAEAVCAALIEVVPDEQREKYLGKELGTQIETLERLVKSERHRRPIPKAVIAGLRTLQAYGNYAAHYEKGGGPQPPPAAIESAMASLFLVAQWFLSRAGDAIALDEAQPARAIHMRQPEPPQPRLLQRRRITKRAQLDEPQLNTKSMGTPASVLGGLYSYYSDAISVCERICREVIDRETELAAAECLVEDLPFIIEDIARERPHRVPRSIALDMIELWRRRSACEAAIQNRTEDVEPLVVELAHRKIINEVIRWFKHDYLCTSGIERNWWVWILFIAGMASFGMCRSGWIDDGSDAGKKEMRTELLQRYCTDATAKATPICLDLASGPRETDGKR